MRAQSWLRINTGCVGIARLCSSRAFTGTQMLCKCWCVDVAPQAEGLHPGPTSLSQHDADDDDAYTPIATTIQFLLLQPLPLLLLD